MQISEIIYLNAVFNDYKSLNIKII